MLTSGLEGTTESTESTGTDTDIVQPRDAERNRPRTFSGPTTPPKAATPLTNEDPD